MKKEDFPLSELEIENAHRVAYLIAGYIRKTLTPAEHRELDECVADSDHNMELFEELPDEDNLQQALQWHKSLIPKPPCSASKAPVSIKVLLLTMASLFRIAGHLRTTGILVNRSLFLHTGAVPELCAWQRGVSCSSNYRLKHGARRGAGTPGHCFRTAGCWHTEGSCFVP